MSFADKYRQTPEHPTHPQRTDKRWYSQFGIEQPVDNSGQPAETDDDRNDPQPDIVGIEFVARQKTYQNYAPGDHTFDRKVDPSKDDHLMKANRNDGRNRRQTQDDLKIRCGKISSLRPDGENCHHDHESH